MARFYEPTPEQEEGRAKWVSERPPAVRAIAERFDPWSVYRLKDSTGSIVTLYSFDESDPVTLTVNVTREYNPHILLERRVFGINPDDLEPCDLPPGVEKVESSAK